jgi:hypothetical protein
MQIPAITPVSVSPVAPLTQFVQRLAAQLGTSMAKETDTSERGGSSPTLTPGLLRATLMSMGVAADAQNMALAEAFSRLGLALTREALTEAHVALAQAPEASPRAYALARAWGLPTSAAALNALTTAIGESPLPLPQALPVELMSWLGLAADTSLEPEALAAHLYLMAQGAGRSTENRLAALLTQSGSTHVGVQDARSALLRLAEGSADTQIRRGAAALASHIEGQQLLNQATRQSESASPFYLAVPVLLGEEVALAEMLLGTWDDEQESEEMPAGTPWLQATVRMTTRRLGRIQAALIGTLDGKLSCTLGTERQATTRLLQRHLGDLTLALAETGDWLVGPVTCNVQSEWDPLWHGGNALHAPRACIDWRA